MAKKKAGRPRKVGRPKTRQTGKRKSLRQDRKLKAKPAGKRKSKKGKTYYERRRNRSDVKRKYKKGVEYI